MIKKPYNQLFRDNNVVMKKLEINMNLRPQNLDFETYYKLADELGNLRG